MFWIYGGSFREGSALFYGPDYLMKEEVVVVTFNYRLGFFGLYLLSQVFYNNFHSKFCRIFKYTRPKCSRKLRNQGHRSGFAMGETKHYQIWW